MDASPLDVIVADGGLGSLLVGYLLAERGRRVGIVERSPTTGTTAVSVLSAGRVEALQDIVNRAPVIGRRSAVVLQPEGGLSVGMQSERFGDAAQAVAIIDRSSVASALVEATLDLGGLRISAGDDMSTDARGAVVQWRATDGSRISARCTVLSPPDVQRLVGINAAPPDVPEWALETEWCFSLDAGLVRARLSVAEGGAAEWWLYGDPFAGAHGFGRIRAHGTSVTLGVVVPLDQVLERRIEVADLGGRLRRHPFIAPLLEGGVPGGVSGATCSTVEMRPDEVVGDGWVLGPAAHPFDAAPLSTEIAMAEVVAAVVDHALSSGRVTSARLSAVPRRLRAVEASARMISPGPIDGWGDDIVLDPSRLVDGVRAMAARFAGAR